MKRTILTLLLLTMTLGLIITQTSCTEKSEPVSKTSYYLDTICKISIYDMANMSEENAEKVIDKAFALCSEYERLLSKTKEGSDIYNINHANGAAVKCDDRTIDLIKEGLAFAELSGGKFDITIGKVTDLWDFHGEDPKLPKEELLQETLSHVGYEQIKIDGNTVQLSDAEGEIDLGGIAKGYIADRLEESLRKNGVNSAVIDLGGNIVVIGNKEGEPFTVGIEKPYSDRTGLVGTLKVINSTVVTSGIYQRYIDVNGEKYHHILDVDTGYPVESDVAGVTIIASVGKSVNCDALSTICLLLGVEKGMELIESMDTIEAVFIDKEGNLFETSGLEGFAADVLTSVCKAANKASSI